ncbi:related to Drug resistance protein YOR378W [Cephalotrichum gorgonifer]|uniref:Related to Drug resistance protein YOR378W n=1 Tax=Cephalotrichum gorgonifer TaxID=2041049 RepID=A0AAE8SU50_9PEZI|nr:related to Drug resistance protein YOR378W [Cephalotrichum gorgonifer]
MEERDVENGKEKRLSLHSVSSAVEAMQRVADRLIATTEAFRIQLREKDSEGSASKTSLPKSDGPRQPATASGSPPYDPVPETTQADAPAATQFPFTTGGSGGTTSTHISASRPSTRPSPPLPTADLPHAASPSTPQLVEARPIQVEPNVGQIDSVTPPEPEGNAHTTLASPVPPFTASSAGQPGWPLPDTPHSYAEPNSPKQSFFRTNISYLREPLNAGTDRAFASVNARGSALVSQFSDGRPPFSLLREVLFVGIICFSQLLLFAAFAQALAPAAEIGATFPDTAAGYLSWYTAAFALGAGAFSLPAARLGDLLGHKRVFVAGFAWLALWSTLAGVSVYVERGGNGAVFLCVCRAMQGIGPAMTVPSGQAMLGSVYQLGRRRNLVMCLLGTSAPLGFVLGAVMASLFARLTSWEWAFFVLGAVCLTLACQSILVLPPDPPMDPAIRGQKFWRLVDVPGIALGVSGFILFAFAWNQAPIASWSTAYVYFLFIIGVLLLGASVYVEFFAEHPLVPLSAMTPTTALILACTAAGWGCFAIWAFYTFQLLVDLRGWTPLLASAAFVPTPITGLLASVLAAYLLRRVTPYWVMLASMLSFALGAALMATAPVGQTYWINSFLSILFVPLGMNMSSPVAAILVANSLPAEHRGVAGSLVFATTFGSISVSLGVAGTVASRVGEEADILAGNRGAMYLAVGLAGLGSLLALVAAVCDTLWPAEPEEGAALRVGGWKGKKANV